MKISFGGWAFAFGPYAAHPVGYDAVARRLKEVGYDAVEICGFAPHVTLRSHGDKESRESLRKFHEELGLEVSGYACDQADRDPTEPRNRDRYLEKLVRHIELCVDLGIRNIRIDSAAPPDKYPDEGERREALKRVAEVFQAAAAKAAEAGLRLHWEFEPGRLFNKPSEIAALAEAAAHPAFGVLFDTAHAYMCAVAGARQAGAPEVLPGGVAELLSRLAGRVTALHLADSDGKLNAGGNSVHAPLGAGKVGLKALAPKLLALPGIEYWTIDSGSWPGSWELLEAQLRYARRLVAASS